MLISGWVKTSLVDYPGKIASVVFTQGCNMRCFYCHNPALIDMDKKESEIDEGKIYEYLKNRRKFIDGVVVTGGEPTIQEGLQSFLLNIKNMGFLIKLDTNGSNPDVLESLISNRVVDYIAMDIKAPIHKYYEICGEEFDYKCINESILIIKRSGIFHEFRTTFAPGLIIENIIQIQQMIGGTSNLFIQKCRGNFKEIPTFENVNNDLHFQLRGF